MKTVLRFSARLQGTTPPVLPCHGAIAASVAIATAVAADIDRGNRYDIGITGEATLETVPSDHEKPAPPAETPPPAEAAK